MCTSIWQIQVFFKIKIEEGQTQRVTVKYIYAGVQTKAQKKLGWYPAYSHPKNKHSPHDGKRVGRVIVSWDFVLMWEQTHGMNHIYFRLCTDNLH